MDENKNKNILTLLVALFVMGYLIFGTSAISDIKDDISVAKNNNNIINVDGDIKLLFFDVGQGDSILIQNGEYFMLIDAGNESNGEKIVNYMKKNKIKKLDYVVATHPHDDHIGGMEDIINNFEIDTFYMPDVITTTKTFEDMLKAMKERDIMYTVPEIGSEIKFDDAIISILSVGSDNNNLNDDSIVIELTYGDNVFLFMADASKSVEKNILSKISTSDVLKVGHHGSSYSTADEFIDKIKPKYAIISVGNNNSYDHPSSETLDRLTKSGSKVFRTDLNGSILMISDGTSINIQMVDTKTN